LQGREAWKERPLFYGSSWISADRVSRRDDSRPAGEMRYFLRMTAPTTSTLREYDVAARSTDVFGRVACSARNHHFIVDGPVQNGCPGEEITPVEVFLTAIAACGVEL